MANGIQPNLAIPGYVLPVRGRNGPQGSYVADRPSVTAVSKRTVQEKATSGSASSTPEKNSKMSKVIPPIVLLDDSNSSSTSSA